MRIFTVSFRVSRLVVFMIIPRNRPRARTVCHIRSVLTLGFLLFSFRTRVINLQTGLIERYRNLYRANRQLNSQLLELVQLLGKLLHLLLLQQKLHLLLNYLHQC